jgi:tetratricopeptide (TPR) repeat protein
VLLALSAPVAADVASPHDITSYPVIWTEPGMEEVEVRRGVPYGETAGRKLALDLYLPPASSNAAAGRKLPVLLFLNGIGDGPGFVLKEWKIYESWMRVAAARGYAAAMGETDPADVVGSLRQLLAFPARHPELGLDGARIGTFAVSANVSQTLPLLMEAGAAPGVRGAVFYYGAAEFPAFRADLPVFHVLAELDGEQLLAAERRLWDRARAAKAPWTLVAAPTLPHAFDAVATTPESFAVIAQTFGFWDAHLKPTPPPRPESEAGRDARLGIAAIYGQRWDEATAIYRRIVEREPASAGAWAALGWAQQNAQQLADAEASLRRAIEIDPKERFAPRRLGIVLAKLDRCAEAAELLAPGLAAGNDVQAGNELGHCQLKQGDTKGAIASFEMAAKSPAPIFRYNLACALSRDGQKERAIAELEKVAAAGFLTAGQWRADSDLAPLQGDPRFEALLARLPQ